MDFNQTLKQVGDFGIYQKLLCVFLIFSSAALCALVYFTQFFIIMVPKHWCYIEQPFNLNFTEEEWKNLTLPKGSSSKLDYDQCKQYNINITEIQQNISLGYPLVLEDSEIVYCQNGWKYDFSSLYPTLATELNWVCENDRLPYWAQTLFYMGTSVGSIVFGFISDRFGRKPSIIASYVIAFLAGISSSFSTSFGVFAALRFFVGACIIPLSEDPYILGLEYIGVEKRTLVIVCWTTGYIVFSVIYPWIAYVIRDWQLLNIITISPLFLIIPLGKWIPESASWLMTRGRKKEALLILKTVARVNGNQFPDDILTDSEVEKDDGGVDMNEAHLTALDLFRTPHLRRHSLIMALVWFVTYCCYHTNTQNTSNLGTDIYQSFTYGALVEIPAMLLLFFGIDWLGRRWPMVITTSAAGLCGLLIICIPEGSPQVFLGLALIMRVTLTTEYTIIIQYAAEIYPTVLRGRGLAFLRAMGTFGLYLSPTIVYLALEKPSLPLVVSGMMMVVVALLTLFLPETLNQNLPHTLEEGEQFGKDQRVWDCPCLTHKKHKQEYPHQEAEEPLQYL